METMVGVNLINENSIFWEKKRVLITGHTGFKGSWLSLWLQLLGAKVTGIALPPLTTPNLFSLARVAEGIDSHYCDIRDFKSFNKLIVASDPEIVFHLAAQPLVLTSYKEPLVTFASNLMGTVHLLESLRELRNIRVAVMVTSDKVYQNLEHSLPYREIDALGGHDPYSASKAACEILISSYRDSFLNQQGVAVASARAGNVIGGGDWSDNRLIPDAVRAWESSKILKIRYPNSIRPWQHVLESLNSYLMLAREIWSQPELAGAYNFGPHAFDSISVRKVVDLALAAYGKGEVQYSNDFDGHHEANLLSLETTKARLALGIMPIWSIGESISRTMNWYRAQYAGNDARTLCEVEIREMMSL